jgi:hypothetical protein
MLAIEAIEVHLRSLRKGQDELREDVRELRADNTGLLDKLDALNVNLGDKLDALNVTLGDKISPLSNLVSDVLRLQKVTLWVMSGLGSLGIVGEILHWF